MTRKSKIICGVLITRLVIFEQLNHIDQIEMIKRPRGGDSLIVLPAVANIFPNPQLN